MILSPSSPLPRIARTAPIAAALVCALTPLAAWAAGGATGVGVLGTALQLPIYLALAIGVHVLLSRIAKWLAGAILPLATGEEEAVRYERNVYGTAERDVLEVVALVLGAGVVIWLGATFAPRWLAHSGVVLLLASVGMDLLRWERATASANFVWFQRGLRHKVHQIAIENIHDVVVHEENVRGFTLRHGVHNRTCRVQLRMNDQHLVSLPRTDAQQGLDDVETLANHVRARRQMIGEHDKLNRAGSDSDHAAATPGRTLTEAEREMRRELKRLRSQAGAPDVPAAVKPPPPASDPDRKE